MRFSIDAAHFESYAVENVGAEMHNELWVPAEALAVFNEHITGGIEVVAAFFGTQFVMPESLALQEILNRFR